MTDLFNEVVWKISAKWAQTKIDCTIQGIKSGCKGECCKGNFYPAKANNGSCYYLSKKGCTLKDEDKPIKCLLYPFKELNGKLVLYGRALIHSCKKNRNTETTILENLKSNFIVLFGEDQWKRVWNDVINLNRDSFVIISEQLQSSLEIEKRLEDHNRIPIHRTKHHTL